MTEQPSVERVKARIHIVEGQQTLLACGEAEDLDKLSVLTDREGEPWSLRGF